MTDFGRKSGLGDMLKSVYDSNDDGVVDDVPDHKDTHQAGGADEIAVTGLTGTTPGAIIGDGTVNINLRAIRIYIDNGTNAATVKVYTGGKYNVSPISVEDNLGKSGSTTSFALNSDGSRLLIKATALGYIVRKTLGATIKRNESQTDLTVWHSADGDDLFVQFHNTATGAPVDLTTLVDTGAIRATAIFISQ